MHAFLLFFACTDVGWKMQPAAWLGEWVQWARWTGPGRRARAPNISAIYIFFLYILAIFCILSVHEELLPTIGVGFGDCTRKIWNLFNFVLNYDPTIYMEGGDITRLRHTLAVTS